MKNLYRLRQYFQRPTSPRGRARGIRVVLMVALGLLPTVVGFSLLVVQAQRPKDLPLKISSVSIETSSNGTLVSIAADGPLSRAQTWQDSEGYHVIVPYAATQGLVKSARGVKVRRVGQSLEILVQTKPGANVTVQPVENRLNLSVSGKLDNRASASETIENVEANEYSKPGEEVWPTWRPQSETSFKWSGEKGTSAAGEPSKTKSVSASEDLFSSSQTTAQGSAQSAYGVSSKAGPPTIQSNSKDVAQTDGTTAEPAPGPAEIALEPADDGLFSSIFSGTSVLVILALGTLGLFVSRKIRSRQTALNGRVPSWADRVQGDWSEDAHNASESLEPARQRSASIEKAGGYVPANGPLKTRPENHLTVATPDSLYSAYRIDQEVGKLILGQPHRMDVVSSRASEDRRAIETSLLKVIASSPDEDERRRACEALEEYGFVARECAALLLAPDAFDRTSAARSLGEIKSPTALPFLLEGLYDNESIVRNQAVMSIGELKLPRAIGALLDMARRHPDVPGSLVSRALSACSVEGLDFFDATIQEPAQLGDGRTQGVNQDITHLEPASIVEDLPDGWDDETLVEALLKVRSEDVAERLEATKDLARYQVRNAVAALTSVARLDAEANVRAQAISSLAAINHESVFPVVLIGMADGSREVRAAAARSLSHLSFDRADAYIRVMETTDEETLPDVARACIQAGIVSQGLDRLASNDRRQAYEAFSIISLLAKAKMTQPIIEAIAHHPNLDVRLTAVRLLANTGEPEVFEQFRELTLVPGICEELKTALLESMYKLDQERVEVQQPVESSAFTGEFLFDATGKPPAEIEGAAESFPGIESHAGEFEQ